MTTSAQLRASMGMRLSRRIPDLESTEGRRFRMSAEARATFGMLLRQYRQEAGLTQEGLAELAGVGVRTLSNLESDMTARPHRDTARRIVAALQLQPDQHARLMTALRATPLPRSRQSTRHAAPPAPAPALPVPPTPAMPVPLTPLIGRESEQAAVVQLLQSAD